MKNQIIGRIEDIAVELVRKRLRKWDDYNRRNANHHPGQPNNYIDEIADEIYHNGLPLVFFNKYHDLSEPINPKISDEEIKSRLELKLLKLFDTK